MERNVNPIKTTLIWLIFSLLVSLALNVLSYQKADPKKTTTDFQSSILNQLNKVDRQLSELNAETCSDFSFLTANFSTAENPTSVFVYKNNSLIAWSTNQFAFRFPEVIQHNSWKYEKSSNIHALYKWIPCTDSVDVLVMIPVKRAFNYENQYLKNTFFSPFQLDEKLELSIDSTKTGNPVFDNQKNYLFSIRQTSETSTDSPVGWIGFVFWCVTLLISFILYVQLVFRQTQNPLRFYLIFTFGYAGIFLLLSLSEFPRLFFQNPLFSSHHFTVNKFIASFTHLTLWVCFGVVALYTFLIKFRSLQSIPLYSALFILYIVLLIQFLRSIIIHSDIQFNFYLFNQVTIVSSWMHLLLFLLLMAGYGILNRLIPQIATTTIRSHTVFMIVATILSLGYTHHLQQDKKFAKYRIFTENSRMNGISRQDPMTELLLEDLVQGIETDTTLSKYTLHPDSANALYNLIIRKHSSILSNQYDIETELVNSFDESTSEYLKLLKQTGRQIGQTNFYNLPGTVYETSYAGFVRIPGSENQKWLLYMGFRNKRNFRSYSLPDLLISESSASEWQKVLSVASYENNKLVVSDQKTDWPEEGSKFRLATDGFEKIETESGEFYVHQHKQQQVVVTEPENPGIVDKLFFFVLIVVVYLLLARILIIFNQVVLLRQPIAFGLTGKFQIVFVFLFMVSFFSTLVFSVRYFRKNYEQEQLQQNEKKRHYIQTSLQEAFYWLNDITATNEQSINSILQELAYRYQTDIHLYNQHGELAGSSQNLLFSKQLVSRLINPEVMIASDLPVNRNEQIGTLSYFTTYTELVNGDFVPLGYIAIPQYFSRTEINSKIDQFLLAVVQIYTLVIILSILLVLIAGSRLATPLRLMEEKLKSMKLTGSNAKIEYRGYDEIGQLVEQYNQTVDELERSTRLLLQSERETAWRTMARQVAHEINNPLTPMKLTLQQLQRVRQQAPEQFDEYFRTTTATLIEQIDNLSRIAATFSQFARLPETEMLTIDIAARVFNTVELFRANSEEVEVQYKGQREGLLLKGDPEQLSRVITNLLKNALQSIPAGRKGKITIDLKRTEQNQVEITISDNGTGISEEAKKNIFKPDFTTKTSGMGLGLSISRAIIENSGGTITFDTEVDKGTTFIIRMPLLP